MPFTLRIHTYRHQIMPTLSGTPFEVGGGTIGRDADNVLVLYDPDLHISRVQARIDCRDGLYYMTDLGRNPSFLNDRPLGSGCETQLAHGDLLTIGAYVIAVDITPGPATGQATMAGLQSLSSFESATLSDSAYEPFGGDALAAAAILNIDAGFEDALQMTDFDPLGVNLFGGSQVAAENRSTEHQHISPEIQFFPGRDLGIAASTIPEDYDPLADYLPARLSLAPAAANAMAQFEPGAGGALSASGADDAVLQALLGGLNLQGFQPGGSTPELAQVAAVMLRQAMGLLPRQSLSGYETQCKEILMAQQSNHPFTLVSIFQVLLEQMSCNANDIDRAAATSSGK
jgi:predicted component of type VI protein secretion system